MATDPGPLRRLAPALAIATAALLCSACATAPEQAGEAAPERPLTIDEAIEKAGMTADEDSKRCISLARIESTRVLDSRNIEFKMLGGKTYINILPRDCPGLRNNKPFMYKTSLNVLCDLDMITVLETSGGFGFSRGATCGLGLFQPLTIRGDTLPEDEKPIEE